MGAWATLDKKKPETLDFLGFRLRFGPDWTGKWWRWALPQCERKLLMVKAVGAGVRN